MNVMAKMEFFKKDYLGSHQRPLMTSAIEMARSMRRTLGQTVSLSSTESDQVVSILEDYQASAAKVA